MKNSCKRLIEVALPIKEISAESVRDKTIRHGHISTLHLWWARRPLPAARAITFASIVYDPDDPNCPIKYRNLVKSLLQNNVSTILKSYTRGNTLIKDDDPYKPYAGIEDTLRNRLLMFIAKLSPEMISYENENISDQPGSSLIIDDRSLIKWETADPTNEQGKAILDIARQLIVQSNNGKEPVILDPFSGGGAIPLEANRLGALSYANDYSPVAYLILKASCVIPQEFGVPGIRPEDNIEGKLLSSDKPIPNTFAYDFNTWAKWLLTNAQSELGKYYISGKNRVISYFWARTAPCSNPTCQGVIPLLRSLILCDTSNKKISLKPKINLDTKSVLFSVKSDIPSDKTWTMLERGNVKCPYCGQITPVEDVRNAGMNKKISEQMVAVAVETENGKMYRDVTKEDVEKFEEANSRARNLEIPSELIPDNQWNIKTWLYGMNMWGMLFNTRQLLALNTFVELYRKANILIKKEYRDPKYHEALATYLALFIDRIASRMTNVGIWNTKRETLEHPFGRQAIPMTWDYPEANPFSESSGGALGQLDWMIRYILHESGVKANCSVIQGDAARLPLATGSIDHVITDPPYFDAIAYADLSDFFYIWLKRTYGSIYPEVFTTPLTPKKDEATALKHRHNGDSEKANAHYTSKLGLCLAEANRVCKSDGVFSIMFAHQSTEAWTALINAIFEAGLTIEATWPIDTELTTALKGSMSALASSVTVTCRQRFATEYASLKEIRKEVYNEVAAAVKRFWSFGLKGADLVVACYGPAVSVFGKYKKVERADGTEVDVKSLLELAREAALSAISGEIGGDVTSRLYFTWASMYGANEQAWDDARMIIQIGSNSEDAMSVARRRGIFVVDGQMCRLSLLKDRTGNFGMDENPSLIDALHRSMRLWQEEKRDELAQYLHQKGLFNDESVWKLAQALFEVMPKNTPDRKLISALLTERKSLEAVARNIDKNTVKQQQLSI